MHCGRHEEPLCKTVFWWISDTEMVKPCVVWLEIFINEILSSDLNLICRQRGASFLAQSQSEVKRNLNISSVEKLSCILLSRNHWTKWRSKTHWTEITCTLAHSVERKLGQRKGEWNTGGKGNEFLLRVSITKAKRSKGGISKRRHQLLNGKSSKQLLFAVNDVWKRSLLGAFRFSVVKPNPMLPQQPIWTRGNITLNQWEDIKIELTT